MPAIEATMGSAALRSWASSPWTNSSLTSIPAMKKKTVSRPFWTHL